MPHPEYAVGAILIAMIAGTFLGMSLAPRIKARRRAILLVIAAAIFCWDVAYCGPGSWIAAVVGTSITFLGRR